MKSLAARSAWITAFARGISAAPARAYADESATAGIDDSDPERARAVAAEVAGAQSAGLNAIHHWISVDNIAPGAVEGEHRESIDALIARCENRPIGENKRLVGGSAPSGHKARAEDLTVTPAFLGSAEASHIAHRTCKVHDGQCSR